MRGCVVPNPLCALSGSATNSMLHRVLHCPAVRHLRDGLDWLQEFLRSDWASDRRVLRGYIPHP